MQTTWRERTVMHARHTVKLTMNRGCFRIHAREDGGPKWHKELRVAAVRAASIRRQVRPPADLATGVLRLTSRMTAKLRVMRRQVARKKSRAMERGASQASSRTVLFKQWSLIGGDHCSGRHGWHIVGSEMIFIKKQTCAVTLHCVHSGVFNYILNCSNHIELWKINYNSEICLFFSRTCC